MLEIRNAGFSIGDFSLKSVSIFIQKAESHVLLGPSGSGKSTLLDLIMGFKGVDGGGIYFNGKNLRSIEVEKRNFGYLPQKPSLFPHLNVLDNILFSVSCQRRVEKSDKEWAKHLMDELGISHLMKRWPSNLSGGEQQRVAFARALFKKPDLLLLDEPFSALNKSLRIDLISLLKKVQKDLSFSTLLVTHDLDDAYLFSDMVHILIKGNILQSGTKKEVFHSPTKKGVADFLGIKNIFPINIKKQNEQTNEIFSSNLNLKWTTSNSQVNKDFFGIRSEKIIISNSRNEKINDSMLQLEGELVEKTDLLNGVTYIAQIKNRNQRVLIHKSDSVFLELFKPVFIYIPIEDIFYLDKN